MIKYLDDTKLGERANVLKNQNVSLNEWKLWPSINIKLDKYITSNSVCLVFLYPNLMFLQVGSILTLRQGKGRAGKVSTSVRHQQSTERLVMQHKQWELSMGTWQHVKCKTQYKRVITSEEPGHSLYYQAGSAGGSLVWFPGRGPDVRILGAAWKADSPQLAAGGWLLWVCRLGPGKTLSYHLVHIWNRAK